MTVQNETEEIVQTNTEEEEVEETGTKAKKKGSSKKKSGAKKKKTGGKKKAASSKKGGGKKKAAAKAKTVEPVVVVPPEEGADESQQEGEVIEAVRELESRNMDPRLITYPQRFKNSRMKPDPIHLRDLKASVKRNGILTPLIVWEIPDESQESGFRHDIISGFSRFKVINDLIAENELSFSEIPIRIYRGNIAGAAEINFAENLQRKDLSPFEICMYLQYMREEVDIKSTDLALIVGKSEAWVSVALKFMDNAIGELQKVVEEGKMSYSLALDVSGFEPHVQGNWVDAYRKTLATSGKKSAVREAKKKAGKAKKKKKKPSDAYLPPETVVATFNSYYDMELDTYDDLVKSYLFGLMAGMAHCLGYDVNLTQIERPDIGNINVKDLPLLQATEDDGEGEGEGESAESTSEGESAEESTEVVTEEETTEEGTEAEAESTEESTEAEAEGEEE